MTSDQEKPDNDQQNDDGPQLAQVIALFNDLLAETKVLETALYDCAEPLNLKSTLRTLAEAESTIRSAKSDLEQVDQIVKQGVWGRIARKFTLRSQRPVEWVTWRSIF